MKTSKVFFTWQRFVSTFCTKKLHVPLKGEGGCVSSTLDDPIELRHVIIKFNEEISDTFFGHWGCVILFPNSYNTLVLRCDLY